jgi:transmembrane sensor
MMKTVVDFPEKGVLAEEAAEWLIRLDADTPPTRQELRALGEWLLRSPAHREELENLAALWGRMNVLTELAVPLGTSNRWRGDRREDVTLDRTPRLSQVMVAAAVVGAFALGLGYFLRGPATDLLRSANGLYATAVGQQTTTELPDGSQIVLNTNSQIRVDYGEHYREMHLLQGEALFTVAKDSRRPFRVYAGSGRIEAIGTAFSVYLKGADVQVTVSEGRVALASVEPPRANAGQTSARSAARKNGVALSRTIDEDWIQALGTLSAGQVATIRNRVEETDVASRIAPVTTVMPIAPQELIERLAWRDGILMFSGEPLEDVVKEVSRYTTVSIEIPDPAIRRMRIGGRFPVGETDVMLSSLESNLNLRVTRLGHNRAILTAADE